MRKSFGVSILFLAGFILFAFLHNVFYAVFGFEEGVMLILSFVCLGGFAVMAGYGFGLFVKKKLAKKK